ncbi:hypothetical protein N9L68_02150 [bacterium]|nr:hypothetical protein [bacterium]
MRGESELGRRSKEGEIEVEPQGKQVGNRSGAEMRELGLEEDV